MAFPMAAYFNPTALVTQAHGVSAGETPGLRYLGFEVLFEHRFGPDMPLYLGIRRGGCELHMSEHHGDETPGSAVRATPK